MKKFLSGFYRFASSWTGTIIIVLFLIFFIAQSFVIPSGSMKRTQLIGDFLFAKKFSYGIPIPHLPWLEIPLLPDFNNNGHLIEGPRPQREDIVIFRKPQTPKVHFVKRCIAVGGDEILYMDKRLLIHFHDLTTEKEIKAAYPNATILSIRGKLWVENPYMSKYPGIQYDPESYTAFEYLSLMYQHRQPIDMHPVHLRELGENAFYKKVEEDHYYMIGDNRDNSSDSRFWGSVPYSLIVGKPWVVYMSLELRS
ncbi:MAG TPA: signal peptidase I, partial [Epsilonproteobacteria bacterium]|nr:signal peptidase I [Campylobacterota bacterium]